MSSRIAAIVAAALILAAAALPARGGRQAVALFPPEGLSEGVAPYVPLLGPALAEKLKDRFDVSLAGDGGAGGRDPEGQRRTARALGASYVITGSVSRIGTAVTLDLTIAPAEEPSRGRTLVVGGIDNAAPAAGALPPVYRRLVIEAAAKLKYLFFGDEVVGEGALRRKIPRPAGSVARSRPIPGEVASVAAGDTDGDGRVEIVAGYPDAIAVYRIEGDDLVEKARIPGTGPGILRIDTADLDRNGSDEIIATGYEGGRASSSIWSFAGKEYRRVAGGIPLFLRPMGAAGEAPVLLGQESDPVSLYKGPVFRLAPGRDGTWERPERTGVLPLPEGTTIYSFSRLRDAREGTRYAVLDKGGRLVLVGEGGERIWESPDTVSSGGRGPGAAAPDEGAAGAPSRRPERPGRLLAADLDGDGADEVVAANELAAAGTFFEGVRLPSDAEVLAFARDGSALQLAWRTSMLGGPAADLFLDPAPASRPIRIGVASRERGKVLPGLSEWKIFWIR